MAYLEDRKTLVFPLAGSDGRIHSLKDAATHPRQVVDSLAAP
jgi:hypothetical protein